MHKIVTVRFILRRCKTVRYVSAIKTIILFILIAILILIPVKAKNQDILRFRLNDIFDETQNNNAAPKDPAALYTDTNFKITISAVGDCTLGSDESYGKYGTFDDEFKKHNYNYGYFFENVRDILNKDDLTIANLETSLTTATKKADKQYAFKGDPSYAKILKEGSVEAVNLANNHTFDYLRKGFDDTVKALDREGIGYFGYGYKYYKTLKGIKIGVLGYTGYDNTKTTKEQIKKDIMQMKKDANIIIVSFHWGEENKYYPNKIQKDLGHFAIDEGADLVVGHHPHLIQGIEKYKGKFIVYSLGNFSFGGNRNPTDKDSFIFQETFIFNKSDELTGTEKNIIPVSVSSLKDRNDFKPTVLTGIERNRVLQKIETLSQGI